MIVDKLGIEFKIGDKIAKAYHDYRGVGFDIRNVSKIENGKIYLDDSKVPIKYPDSLLIINKLM